MSLFGSLLPGFDDDPFFGGPRSIMRQMDRMMSSMIRDPFQDDPFFSSGHDMSPFPALTAGPLGNTRHHQARVADRDPFALAIPNMTNIMSSMDQLAGQGNCHTFSSSSVMTMTTGPDGRPQVYQASASSRSVPGGVRETRRTVSDSRSGTRKMAIGHHIGDRSHIIEREQSREGGLEEKQEYINLEEDEAQQFDQEFRRRSQHVHGGNSLDYRPRNRSSNTSYNRVASVPAITSSSHYRRRSRPMLSITAGPSEDRARRRDREERGQRSGRR
ncbi:myeloid leukemia factor-like [Penaeus japonicus]|uniref:Myeloid leukemia factor n=1 Tax=Penaeus japonicus TaxID=27405 RepID=A0A288Y7C7_PENJP|nr:myeloid leukemia factor-like [Penaeus japonicus]ASR74832.1 Myeloid leukemia factor [Penaeus japonicus]